METYRQTRSHGGKLRGLLRAHAVKPELHARDRAVVMLGSQHLLPLLMLLLLLYCLHPLLLLGDLLHHLRVDCVMLVHGASRPSTDKH